MFIPEQQNQHHELLRVFGVFADLVRVESHHFKKKLQPLT